MSVERSGRSGSGWAKGCGLACAGCGVVLVGVVALVLTLAPGGVQRVREAIDRQQWLVEWRGPEPEGPVETVLPVEVDGLTRGEVTAGPGPGTLGLEGESLLAAVYSDDRRTVEVWVGQVGADERGGVFADVEGAVTQGDWGSLRQTRIGTILTLTFGRPPRRVSLWWGDDWLFVFRSEEARELGDFPEVLLRSIERAPPASETGRTPEAREKPGS